MKRRENERCPVCGAEIDDGGLQVDMPFIFTTSKGERIIIHSECMGDLIAFIIKLKEEQEKRKP